MKRPNRISALLLFVCGGLCFSTATAATAPQAAEEEDADIYLKKGTEKEWQDLQAMLAGLKEKYGADSPEYVEHLFDEVGHLVRSDRAEEAGRKYEAHKAIAIRLATSAGPQAETEERFIRLRSSMLWAEWQMLYAAGKMDALIEAADKRLAVIAAWKNPLAEEVRLGIMCSTVRVLKEKGRLKEAGTWLERLTKALSETQIENFNSALESLGAAAQAAIEMNLKRMAQFIVGKCLKSAQSLPLDSRENYWYTLKAAELEEDIKRVPQRLEDLQKTLTFHEKQPQPEWNRMRRGYMTMGNLYTGLPGKDNELKAVHAYDRSLEAALKSSTDEAKVTEGRTQHALNLALLRLMRGGGSKEFENMRKALDEAKKKLGQDHKGVLNFTRSYADKCLFYTRYQSALASYQDLLEAAVRQHDDKSVIAARDHRSLGLCQMKLGQMDAAVKSLEKSAALLEAALGSMHPEVAISYRMLGELRYSKGDIAGARAYQEHVYKIDLTAFGPGHDVVTQDMDSVTDMMRQEKRLADAEVFLQKHFSLLDDKNDPLWRHRALTSVSLAAIYRTRGQNREAEAMCQHALQSIRGEEAGSLEALAACYEQHVMSLADLQRFSEAAAECKIAVLTRQRLEAAAGRQQARIAKGISNYAELLGVLGHSKKAIEAQCAELQAGKKPAK